MTYQTRSEAAIRISILPRRWEGSSTRRCVAARGRSRRGQVGRGQGRGAGAGHCGGDASPTFTLLIPYEGEKKLYHFDLYRLADPDEFWAAGLDEFVGGDGIAVIEWPQMAQLSPERSIVLRIARGEGDDDRVIELENCGVPGFDAGAAGGMEARGLNILGIDSSGPVASCAVMSGGRIVHSIALNHGLTHSEALMPAVDAAMRASGLTCADIDAFAAVAGPGSFTGVRIGVCTAKGLAHAAGKPCAAVDALEALAMNFYGFGGLVCPILDALPRAGLLRAV